MNSLRPSKQRKPHRVGRSVRCRDVWPLRPLVRNSESWLSLRANGKVLCRCVTRLRRKRRHLAVADGAKHGFAATDLSAARHGELSGLLVIEGDVLPPALAREHRRHLDMAVAGFHRKCTGRRAEIPSDPQIPSRSCSKVLPWGSMKHTKTSPEPLMTISIAVPPLMLRQNKRARPTFERPAGLLEEN